MEHKSSLRSLFYGLDVTITWELDCPQHTEDLTGVIRLYNIAQDTEFKLGGDTDTSYMYQLGHKPGLEPQLLDQVLTGGEELFELLSNGIVKKLITKLHQRMQQ